MNTCVVTLTNSIVEFHCLIKFKVCLTVTLGENIFHDYFVQNGLHVKLYDENCHSKFASRTSTLQFPTLPKC